jgi:outer membrane receptor for ferrienterochelin and colicins
MTPTLATLAALTLLQLFQPPARQSSDLTSQTGQDRVPPPVCGVSGTVLDATGAAVPGALVEVPGRATRTVTDEEGRYCLSVPETGAQPIRVSLAGFRSETATVTVTTATTERGFVLHPAHTQDVVVTATRTARHLDSVPVRTEVVGRSAIVASGARTLADAMEFTTGVRVENNCQNCNFSQMRLLGLEGPYTQILVDGQPVISSLAQVYGIEQIPARMIERIEVVKGGGSATYGAGAVGGIVNVIPREAERTSGVVEARAENGGFFNGAVDWVDGGRQTFFSVFAQHDRMRARDVDADGFTEVSRRHLSAVGVRGSRFLDDGRGKLTVDVSHIGERRRGGDRIDRPPHEALVAEAVDSARTSLSASWMHAPGGRYDYRLTTASALTDRDSYYGTGMDPRAYGETSNALLLVDGQVNHYLRRQILSWGGQVSRDRTRDVQPAYGRALDTTAAGGGAFLQSDLTLRSGLQTLAGVRVDWHSALPRPVVSPRFAVLVSPADPLDIRLSIARGFRPPQVFDEDLHLSSVGGEVRIIRLDPNLREEGATSLMAGVEWKPMAGPGQALVEFNAFHTRLTDLFHAVEDNDPLTPALELRKTNLGGARVYGVEANLGWGIADDLVVQGGVVVQRAVFDAPEPDFGSREFFRTPRQYGNLTARWTTHGGWEVFGGMKFTGAMKAPHYAGFIPVKRLETTRAFATLDLSLGRRLSVGARTLVVTLSGRNLTNAYQRDLDRGPLRDASYVYGPRFPRSLGLLARVEF